MSAHSLPKARRLTGKKSIEIIFRSGKGRSCFPLKVLRTLTNSESSFRVMFSVSARRFPRAVDRNRIKRMMREAFRLEQDPLHSAPAQHIAYIYIASEILPFTAVREKMAESIRWLIRGNA